MEVPIVTLQRQFRLTSRRRCNKCFSAAAVCWLLLLVAAASPAAAWYQPKPLTSLLIDYSSNGGSFSDPATMYQLDTDALSPPSISRLQRQGGKKVICYYSFGTAENWRADYKQFPAAVMGGLVCNGLDAKGNCNSFSDGERWVDVRSNKVRQILENRIKHARNMGCDGMYADNMLIYGSNLQLKPITRFTISLKDNVNFAKWTANTVHKYNMSIGFANPDGPMSRQVASLFDWAISESCNEFTDWSKGEWYDGKYVCDANNVFIAQNKAVFVLLYQLPTSISFPKGVCTDNNANGFSTRRYSIQLDGQGFPSGNCLPHRPASCAPWRQCIRPAAYQQYKQAGAGMRVEDMIGQCVRARQTGCYQ